MAQKRYHKQKHYTKKRELHPTQKKRYRVKNWAAYNQALVNRGNITMWLSSEIVDQWYYQGQQKQGAPFEYSAEAICMILTIRALLCLTYRATEGFLQGLITLMQCSLAVPDYSTLQRRHRTLTIVLPRRTHDHEPLHIVLDSTGLKVYGEGEWKVRQHGWSQHRRWIKLHVGIDPKTGDILAYECTSNAVTDATAGETILESISEPIDALLGDGGYDKKNIYAACQKKNIATIIPPQKNARIRTGAVWNSRNRAVKQCARKGRDEWKKQSGYHQRSLVETMMFRYKTAFGDKPQARTFSHQVIEVGLKCALLNQFTALGMPESYAVAA